MKSWKLLLCSYVPCKRIDNPFARRRTDIKKLSPIPSVSIPPAAKHADKRKCIFGSF
ncbi:hypothetical protein HMPREF1325_0649 [Treponema socranskii subsp. socranskii VPI DR56BR1116 = ATCC 35536]|uniref:Uncharacterized protein n=1 Tax=Treponema socranskii subsp. socranskii VPI DR56BR1116 = ATCC 35536 TaxID=1125725 RepID=U1GTC7_TRESO|nr:hypothetical protein HMPREF1325_0649 [Treponema socranskii subsp. socranskii VPI DR56BR1116 = ATCC 35536]